MNKSELIDAIAKHADISKAAAGRALDATVNSIKGSLKKGDIVTLVGFGSFYVGKRTARQGRNPRTGATIKIKAAKVPKFRAGKDPTGDLSPAGARGQPLSKQRLADRVDGPAQRILDLPWKLARGPSLLYRSEPRRWIDLVETAEHVI